jgi:hypothetical protein
MSIFAVVILSVIIVGIISLGSILIQHHKKIENQDGYTYWFENVDELL